MTRHLVDTLDANAAIEVLRFVIALHLADGDTNVTSGD